MLDDSLASPASSAPMALPSFVVDTYRRYKRGTEEFVNWLATTARATGKVEHLFKKGDQNVLPQKNSKRLKGKARKDAKAVASPQGSIEVPMRTFHDLAAAIVKSKLVVPLQVMDILKDAIGA